MKHKEFLRGGEMGKSTNVCFWTTGENMTKILRDLWEERSCIHAFKTAKEGLGMNNSIAISLFEGRMKLKGNTRKNPDLYSANDNYNGITVNGMIDWFEKKYIELRINKLTYDLTLRNNMIKYLNRGRGAGIFDTGREAKNAALQMEKKTFEYLRNLMFLYNMTDRSIADFENRVEEALRDSEFDPEQSYMKDELDAQNTKVLFDESLKEFNKIVPGAPKTLDEYIENETKIDNLQAVKGSPKDSSSGWLNPEGDFYPCPYLGHISLITKLVEERIIEDVENESDLEQKRWAKISSFRIYNVDEHFSNKQKDFIFDFITAHKLDKVEINHCTIKSGKLFDYFDEKEGLI